MNEQKEKQYAKARVIGGRQTQREAKEVSCSWENSEQTQQQPLDERERERTKETGMYPGTRDAHQRVDIILQQEVLVSLRTNQLIPNAPSYRHHRATHPVVYLPHPGQLHPAGAGELELCPSLRDRIWKQSDADVSPGIVTPWPTRTSAFRYQQTAMP